MKKNKKMKNQDQQFNFMDIFFIALTFVFITEFIAILANLIKGVTAPPYFRQINNWNFTYDGSDIFMRGMAVLISLLFVITYQILSPNSDYTSKFSNLLKAAITILSCWIMGVFSILLTISN